MGKKVFFVALIWSVVAVVVFILYIYRGITPVEEIITWAIGIWSLLAILGAAALAISGWILKHDFSKPEEKMSDIVKAKHDCANIEVKPRVSGNLAVLEVKNIGVDADFTAEAIVVEGVPPKTRYTMCWDSSPHLEHPIKRGGKSTIIVAEKTSAIRGMETPGIVKNGLLIYKMGISGVERVGATTQDLSDTVKLNIQYPTMAKPVDDSCTIEITITSTPSLLTPFDNQKYKIEIDHEQEHKLLIAPLPELETHIKLDLVKLFHDGKDIRSELEMAQDNKNTNEQASAEIHFESWFTDVTNALENTDYKKVWYENKVVDYRQDKISEYLSASDRALERLESIIKLISHKEDSQSLGYGIQLIIAEPEISIDIDKCSVSNYGQSDQAIEVALTLKVKSPPVNIADLQLYMGDEMLKLLSPAMPITQRNNKECYITKHKLSLGTIYKVEKDSRDKYHIRVVTKRQEVDSEVFSINNP